MVELLRGAVPAGGSPVGAEGHKLAAQGVEREGAAHGGAGAGAPGDRPTGGGHDE